MLHWHDGQWTTIALRLGLDAGDLMTPDGRGGGRVFAPAEYNLTVFGLAWVPGTTSVWAVGEADKNYAKPPGPDTEAVILKYGR